jgi:hypothetical protein
LLQSRPGYPSQMSHYQKPFQKIALEKSHPSG